MLRWIPHLSSVRSRTTGRPFSTLSLFLGVCFVMGWPAAALAQGTGAVHVKVSELATQAPLPDAQVLVVGTQIGGLSNAAGDITLGGIPAGSHTLRVKLIGFKATEQAVNVVADGTTEIDVRLEKVAIELDAVVVTGTAGATQRRAVGNAVGNISAADVQAIAPTPKVSNLIAGRSAGVVVIPGTGMVGSGPRIRIRGASSFSLSDQPLLYIDGIRVDNDVSTGPRAQGTSSVISRLNDLNPEEIESIEIIKGPAAATLYGTEAANGVIQVITKKGRPNSTQVDVSASGGANWLMNPGDVIPTSYALDGDGQVVTFDPVASEDAHGTPLFQTGQSQRYDVSVRGGGNTTRYFVAAGYDQQTGIEPNNKAEKISTRLNLGIFPSERFNASLSIGYIQGTINVPFEGSSGRGLITNAVFAVPLKKDSPTRGFLQAPPEVLHSPAFTNRQGIRRITQSLQLNNQLTTWFNQRLTIGMDLASERNEGITRRDASLADFFSTSTALGSKSAAQNNIQYITVDYGATAKKALTKDVSSATSVGAQYYRRHDEFLSANGREFPASGLESISATAITTGSDDFLENTTVGVYAQEQLGWRDQAFLTAAIRVDNNSAFGENFDFVVYPKVSGTWVVSEAPFWKWDWVNTLRLRAAYGQSGQQPRAFAALRTYAPVTGGDGGSAVTTQFVGNPDLAPERSSEFETGFDAGLFDQRLGIELTYYRRTTRDAILERSTAPSLGFPGFQFVNAGAIQTVGAEMKMDIAALKSKSVDWNWTINLSKNSNKVLDLGGDPFFNVDEDGSGFITPLGSQRHQVGYPLGAWFGKKVLSAEVDPETGIAGTLMCASGGSSPLPCDDAPVLYLGRSAPNLEGGVSSTLTLFGRLRLYALVDFKSGVLTFNNTEGYRCQVRLICRENVLPLESDPVRVAVAQSNRVYWSSYLQNSSFAKLREVSASYTLPSSITGRLGANNGSLTLSGRNLHTWTDYPGMDPELMFLSDQFTRTEQANTPPLSQFVMTLRLAF
jgi:TonB-linked SusC/RagA family outer membrane protein